MTFSIRTTGYYSSRPGLANPMWSPDGTQIAFQSGSAGSGWNIAVMDADGRNIRIFEDAAGTVGQAAWSPDGRYLAYSSMSVPPIVWDPDINQTTLFLLDVETFEQRALVMFPETFNIVFSWSPDGARIAFVTLPQHDLPVVILNVIVPEEYELLALPSDADYIYPTWSPDGTQIAYVSFEDGRSRLNTVNIDGSEQRAMPDSGQIVSRPLWSNDGRRVAITTIDASSHRLLIWDTLSDELTSTLEAVTEIIGVDWSPDETRFVFQLCINGASEIFIADLSGGDPQQLTYALENQDAPGGVATPSCAAG